MNQRTAKNLYGISHGCIVAISYFILKKLDGSGGLALFGSAAIISFLFHSALKPRNTFTSLFKPGVIFRGCVFGITQVLLFEALADGQVSFVIVASSLGTIIGMALSAIFLRERLSLKMLTGVILSLVGSFYNPKILTVTFFAILGGMLQGVSSFLTRKLMIEPSQSLLETTVGTLGYGGLVSCVFLMLRGSLIEVMSLNILHVTMVSILITFVQYSVCYLYRILDSQRAAVLTLSRIPAAIILEISLAKVAIGNEGLISATLIMFGSLYIFISDSYETNSYKRAENDAPQEKHTCC